MKNRLEVAREFLREEGVIFIQCDDNEQAYLKVLCDEIFGRENFVGCFVWRRTNNQANVGDYARVKDYILVYSKKRENFKFNRVELSEKMKQRYDLKDDKGLYRCGNCIDPKRGRYSYGVINPNGKVINSDKWIISKEKLLELDSHNLIHWTKNHPRKKIYLQDSIKKGSLINDFWDSLSSNQESDREQEALFDTKVFNNPKPEALIKRIIEISTQENDLVMDFFAGSGTTLAVAMKMKRRFVGIEQMEYIESITKERLKKVIAGEQGGISKAVGWSGGGGFVYAELMPLNAIYKEKLINASEEKELEKLYKELETKAFVDYRVDIQEMLIDREFHALDLEDKKEVLYKILDANMDYVPYADIDDASYGVSAELRELNRIFYKDGEYE